MQNAKMSCGLLIDWLGPVGFGIRVRTPSIMKRTPDLDRKMIDSLHCWSMYGAEE